MAKTAEKNGRAAKILTSQPFVLFVFIIAVSIITNAINPRFLTWSTINSVMSQATTLGLIACGATILVISGHFDISVGRMVGLCTCTMAILINSGMNEVLAGLLGVGLCILCSVINGSLSILFNAPTMIVTLATGSIYYSIALIMTKGYMQTLYGKFRFLASFRFFGRIPFLYLMLLVGFVFVFLLLRHTRTGREVYAIGTNARSAYLSGINVNLCRVKFFALSGALIGFACMFMLSRVSAAQATSGDGMELEAIGAVVIGGSSINGGKGGVVGTFFGVILLSMISTAINMLHINAFYEYFFYGLVILIALAITALREYAVRKQRG